MKFITIPNNEADWLQCRAIDHVGAYKIYEGKVAFSTVAGGHITRLGSSMPKGIVSIKLPKQVISSFCRKDTCCRKEI
jgi:UDP-N-acetylglucosamine pyrophosphorylase